MVLAAASSFSTQCTRDAPRESASRPIAPEPANKSRTCNPRKSPNSEVRVEKIASRARSEVGLVAPATLDSERPFATPAIILIASTLIYEICRCICF